MLFCGGGALAFLVDNCAGLCIVRRAFLAKQSQNILCFLVRVKNALGLPRAIDLPLMAWFCGKLNARNLETRGVFALNSSPIPTLARAAAGDAGRAGLRGCR